MDATKVFEILAREHSPMLLAYLRTCIRDTVAVDDLYQETMLAAWRKLPTFDHNRSFAAWIRGIARNLILDYYRQQARNKVLLDTDGMAWLEERFAAIENRPGDGFADKLLLLRQCIEQLPERYRIAVQRRYQQRQSLELIGRQLSISLAALQKRLTRARLRLSECLQRKLEIQEAVE